jgi:hypothetical protein
MKNTLISAETLLAPVFEKVFGRIYGEPCWGVRPGYGSFLTLEFGKPFLKTREPIVASKDSSIRVREGLARRSVFVHGEWHLWIYCCDWEVLSKGKAIGDSSTKLKVRRAADCLDGQKLTRFSMSPRNVRCVFEFDLGATLKTKAYDKDSEQWMLFEPSYKVLTLRADGRYSHERSNSSEDDIWKGIRV